VRTGTVTRNGLYRVMRGGEKVYEGKRHCPLSFILIILGGHGYPG
jgi:hypothetical protein